MPSRVDPAFVTVTAQLCPPFPIHMERQVPHCRTRGSLHMLCSISHSFLCSWTNVWLLLHRKGSLSRHCSADQSQSASGLLGEGTTIHSHRNALQRTRRCSVDPTRYAAMSLNLVPASIWNWDVMELDLSFDNWLQYNHSNNCNVLWLLLVCLFITLWIIWGVWFNHGYC